MPWELTIRRADESPLGERNDVVRRISAAAPGTRWIEEPSMLEQIKDMPDHPFHALIPTWPEETRAGFARSRLLGDYDGEEFSIQLYGFESDPLTSIGVEVRGNGNPLPVLAAMCTPNGWLAVDDTDGQPLDLTLGAAQGWDRFRDYRDSAVRRIEDDEDPDD